MATKPKMPNWVPSWEYVTPAKAQAYLDQNYDRQRSLKGRIINRYAESMGRGEWQPTHQGIAVNEHGELIDGQQRCSAIVKSGTAQWVLVSKGVPVLTMGAIDIGSKRSPSDYFRVRGEGEYSTNKAAAASLLWRYRTERWASAQQVSNDVIFWLYEQEFAPNPELDVWIAQAGRMSRSIIHLGPAAALVGIHLTHGSVSVPAEAEEFLDGLGRGIGLVKASDGRVRLRQELMNPKTTALASATLGSQYKSRLVLSLWAYTLKRWLNDQSMTNLPKLLASGEDLAYFPEYAPPEYDPIDIGLEGDDDE